MWLPALRKGFVSHSLHVLPWYCTECLRFGACGRSYRFGDPCSLRAARRSETALFPAMPCRQVCRCGRFAYEEYQTSNLERIYRTRLVRFAYSHTLDECKLRFTPLASLCDTRHKVIQQQGEDFVRCRSDWIFGRLSAP